MEVNRKIIEKVQVNAPFRMLVETYLDLFLKLGLNPEIGLDADALDHFSLLEMRDIAGAFQAGGRRITIHGPFLDLSPGSQDEKIREVTRYRLEQVLERVPLFQPATVVCHLGYEEDRYRYYKETWREKSLTVWAWFAEELARRGTRMMLENVYEYNPEEMLPFFKALSGKNVGFCLDTGHQSCFGQVPLSRWLQVLGPYLGQMHLHDNNGGRDEHLPIGQGGVNFSPVISFLKKQDPLPVLTLEPHEEKDLWPSLTYLSNVLAEPEKS